MGRQITIVLTPELFDRAFQRKGPRCRCCLIATALQEADGQSEWECGTNFAQLEAEIIMLPQPLMQIIGEFDVNGKQLRDRLVKGEETFVLTVE